MCVYTHLVTLVSHVLDMRHFIHFSVFYNKSKSSSLSLYLFTARRTLEVSTHVT